MAALQRIACVVLSIALLACAMPFPARAEESGEQKEYIKWVDFNVCYPALEKTLAYDIDTHGSDCHLRWIELLAYLGAKYGGDFSNYKEKDLTALVTALQEGKQMAELTANMKYYSYYLEAYTAVLGGFVGEYRAYMPKADNPEERVWENKYGLKAFSPVAQGYGFDHYEDFGSGRTYGYKRRHLGHDLFGATGTPIIAVESGIVEVLGWNQYGGWRIGIRSFDGKRYYYYAHLRKDRPYHVDMVEGKVVKAGDVIGYMGRTGYSSKENTNNIRQTHLHLGLQLIFHPSQKDGPKEIWVDLYEITKLLRKNKSAVYRVDESKEYYRQHDFFEPSLNEAELVAGSATDRLFAPPDEKNEGVEIPIIMYHRISGNTGLLGEFVISPQEFEEDLTYIKEQGYQTVTMADLIAYVHDGGSLPEKPIMLTFDDGEYSVYYHAFPMLKKYGMKAVVSIIGKVTDEYTERGGTQNYPNLVWPQIKEMQESGLIEFQNHSYNLHGTKKGVLGAKKARYESEPDYRQRLSEDLNALQKRMEDVLGRKPDTFVYPFGAISRESGAILREIGFTASLSCNDRINRVVPGDPNCLFMMGRSKRSHGGSFEKVLMSASRAAK